MLVKEQDPSPKFSQPLSICLFRMILNVAYWENISSDHIELLASEQLMQRHNPFISCFNDIMANTIGT